MAAGLGRGSASLVLFVLGVLLAAASVATAATYPVGDQYGNWTLPSTANNIDYSTWAARKTFVFGDELAFQYQNDTHNVLLVNATSYAACETENPINEWDSGDDVIELVLGYSDYYFMCGQPGHCGLRQKLHIKVSQYAAPPVPSTTPGTATPPPPPSKNGSPSSLPQWGIIILSIAIGFFSNLVL